MITPEQLVQVAQLLYPPGQERPAPEIVLLEALEFYRRSLELIENHSTEKLQKRNPWPQLSKQEIVANLIQYIEQSGKSQTEIARELDVTPATIALWRKGKIYPSERNNARIAQFLVGHRKPHLQKEQQP